MWSTVLPVAVIVKSIAIFGAFAGLRATVDPIYSSPQCALRLVNESDPGAYAVHPFWKDLSYDDSCSGDQLTSYIANQSSKLESFLQVNLTNLWSLLGVLTILHTIFTRVQQKGILNVCKAVPIAIVHFCMAFMFGTLVLMQSHYEQDVTFMTGASIHHAFADKPGLDDKNGSTSQGYLICGMLNRLFYSFVVYNIIVRSPRLRRNFNPHVMVALVNIIVHIAVTTVKKSHPLYHEMVENGTYVEAMENAMPYTVEWRAYYHAVVHHDTGFSFAGDPMLDPIFDTFLTVHAYTHSNIFSIPGPSSLWHHIFSTGADMAMGGICVLIMFFYFYVGTSVVDKLYPSSEFLEGSAFSKVTGGKTANSRSVPRGSLGKTSHQD